MNREEYLAFHEAACQDLIEITKRKNNDYCGKEGAQDPFANFRKCEQMGICSVEVGFLTRMTDKFARITSLVSGVDQKVKDEAIEDTLKDLANYSILLAGYLKSKQVRK